MKTKRITFADLSNETQKELEEMFGAFDDDFVICILSEEELDEDDLDDDTLSLADLIDMDVSDLDEDDFEMESVDYDEEYYDEDDEDEDMDDIKNMISDALDRKGLL